MHQSKWIKRLMVLAAALFAGGTALALTGCNTTSGIGQDIEAAGDAIEDAADDAAD